MSGAYSRLIRISRRSGAFAAYLPGYAPAEVVSKRWDEMLDAEAAIIARQTPGPRMHSGVS